MSYAYYVIKSGDQFIASSKNVITTNGYLMINKYLANAAQDWAGALAVGVANITNNSTASATDTSLNYEVDRYPIILKSYRTISGSNQIMIKANMDPLLSASIVEVGAFPSFFTTKRDYVFSDFSENVSSSSAWITNAGFTASTSSVSRLGTSNIFAGASVGWVSNNYVSFDTTVYGVNDYASLLTYVPAAMSGSFRILLADTGGSVWSSSTASTSFSGAGWFPVAIPLGFNVAASFTNSINSVSLIFGFNAFGAGSACQFDALKLTSGDILNSESQIVSRTIFSSPIVKAANQQMQLEYYIQVT